MMPHRRVALLVLAACACAPGARAQDDARASRRPNVIVILTDDQGTVDVGAYGADDLSTKHMDALATRGVRFTQFYAGAPVCSPSRASLLTGRVPWKAGVPGNVSSQRGGKSGLPPAEVTIAEMLREAGYATAHIGKWHLGHSPEIMPNAQGFDRSFGHMGGCIDNYSHFFYWNGPNAHDLYLDGEEVHEPGVFFGDLMVREATRFMREHREDPFFIYFAINMPHYPYQGDPEWLDHYRERGVAHPRDLYAAFLSTTDARIGALLAALDELELREETIVIFQSDHGHSVEERAHGGGGSAGPHRGHKFETLEGGLRVPAIISWPGHLPEGETRDQIGFACDWLPTIAALCDVPLPDRDLDGHDLGEVLRAADATTPHEELHWESGRQWAVRRGEWKLWGRRGGGEGGESALYRIPEDPGEANDLSSSHPDIVRELRASHERWRREVGVR